MPIAEKNSVVAGENPVISGTMNVEPNMATTCCMPMPMVRGQLSRSSGATTSPGATCLPSPCLVQPRLMVLRPSGPRAGRRAHRCRSPVNVR